MSKITIQCNKHKSRNEKVIQKDKELKEKYDFVVTRAVAKIDKLLPWSRKVLAKNQHNLYPNGLIALKGDLKEELKLIPKFEYKESIHIPKYFNEHFFDEKYVFYVQG